MSYKFPLFLFIQLKKTGFNEITKKRGISKL